MVATINKYNSVVTTLNYPLPSWVVQEDDQLRVAAYDAYLDIYRNVPTTFKLARQGTEDNPIYIPSAKRVVEAVNRYLAKGWKWVVSSASANEADAAAAQVAFQNLMTREGMKAKFSSFKRNLTIKGDAFWHLLIDSTQPEGQRISIKELDPRQCFRIANPTDNDRTDGWYIVSLYYVDQNTQIALRQEYRKNFNNQAGIYSRLTFWEIDGWDDRFIGHPDLKPVEVPDVYKQDPNVQQLLTGYTLPSTITELPVYHVRNGGFSTEEYGISALNGIETLIAGMNSSVSDEDISLALQGLGVYWTNSKPPKDADGNQTDWEIWPGVVLEMAPNSEFGRIDGVKDVKPYQDHMGFLSEQMDKSAGLSAIATGKVDVAVAESGVALRLELSPILSQNEETETALISVMDQMTHDLLTMWLPLDGFKPAEDITVSNAFGSPIPIDRAAIIKEVTDLVTAQLMSKEFAIAYLQSELGYQFPGNMLQQIGQNVDEIGARLASIGDGTTVGTTPASGAVPGTSPGTAPAPAPAPQSATAGAPA